ncbi:MAG TPA: phenylalanine--tRNA ligase subunit beta [Thermoleophilaceae bacterium]|nr:phenylalanine--tRNA ligase subunit beta [Thermoleophilaceae bacterium]
MRVPYAWLRSYCDPDLSAKQAADKLTMAGDKLERLHRVGVGDPAAFVTGRVLEAEQHPDADRLTVCKVDVGRGEPQTIVCGAPNVASGQTVAVALPGAVMPDGSTLGQAKLRGVVSDGMILAEDEVGIGEDHHGIMVLDGDLPVGAPLAEHLPIADEVLELEVTPNRPDLMGVYGVARDLHAVTEAPLAPDPTDEDATPQGDDQADEHIQLEVDPEICLRFTARVFEDVKIGPSPLWLKQRLMAAGQRPISNVVDITNYVMLATGQPLHAFDLDKVRGGKIVVRRAADGEKMVTLDDAERTFDHEVALVCDGEGPSGIAGIMGGQVSEVSASTTRVLMEAATWVGPNIMRSSKQLGLRTEASARFEKQLHPEQAIAAQRLAARLMVELCGARMVPGTADAYPNVRGQLVIPLRQERITRLLGTEIDPEIVRGILERLGFELLEGTGWVVPPWRDSDVRREADLIEEVARIHGLEKLPTTLPARRAAVGRLTESQRLRRRVEDLLRDRGLDECIAYSFVSPRALEQLRLGGEDVLELQNPLSEEQSVLRPLLLPGLLDAAHHNAAHGRPALALFESAHVYAPAGPLDGAAGGSPEGAIPALERHHLGVLATRAAPGGWRTPGQPADFFSARALLEAVLGAAGLDWGAREGGPPFLHPGRAATVVAGDRELGWLGEVHPQVASAWDLDTGAAGFEVDVDAIVELSGGEPGYQDVTSYPAVLQDIAVVVGEDTPAADVVEAVRAGGGELLATVELFDVYRGEQAGEGAKSLALRLAFQAPDRTLTDEEVAELRTAIEGALERIGGRLRA